MKVIILYLPFSFSWSIRRRPTLPSWNAEGLLPHSHYKQQSDYRKFAAVIHKWNKWFFRILEQSRNRLISQHGSEGSRSKSIHIEWQRAKFTDRLHWVCTRKINNHLVSTLTFQLPFTNLMKSGLTMQLRPLINLLYEWNRRKLWLRSETFAGSGLLPQWMNRFCANI